MEKLRVHTQEVDTKNTLGIRVVSNIVVSVSTKDTFLAGTDAHVFLSLGKLGDYPLITVGEDDFEITRGLRIAQMVIAPVSRVDLVAVDEVEASTRGAGGFGSTGV